MSVIPPEVATAAAACDAFIVEDLRSARRYLRKIGFTKNFDELPFFELTKIYISLEKFVNDEQ